MDSKKRVKCITQEQNKMVDNEVLHVSQNDIGREKKKLFNRYYNPKKTCSVKHSLKKKN